MNLLRLLCWEVAALLSIGALSALSAQTTSPEPATSPAVKRSAQSENSAKPAKVWTNDDIGNVRTPADKYADSKASAPSAQKKIETAPTSTTHDEKSGTTQTDEVGGVEKLIQKTQEDVRQKQNALNEAEANVAAAENDLRRSELKSTASVANADLDYSKQELETLQTRLAQLKSRQSPEPIHHADNQ